MLSGTRTLPRPDASSSSSRRDDALGAADVPDTGDDAIGERVAEKGLDVTETPEGVGAGDDEEGEVRAAKSELAASEMRSEARFWLLVNLEDRILCEQWSQIYRFMKSR